MALVGNLKDLKLANIIQLNCMEKNDAVFKVDYRKYTGKIYFEEGNIVHAEFGELEGEQAFQKILGIKEGPFQVEINVKAPKKTINSPWNSLLLDNLRLIDEAEEARGDKLSKISRELKNINGVRGVLICSTYGEIILEEEIVNGKRASAAMAFVGRKLDKIGRAAKTGKLKSTYLAGKGDKTIVTNWGQEYITLNLDSQSASDLVEQAAEKVLISNPPVN